MYQKKDSDYIEIFGIVIKPTTICIILSMAISHGWPLHLWDVNNAFLYDHLYENVYG